MSRCKDVLGVKICGMAHKLWGQITKKERIEFPWNRMSRSKALLKAIIRTVTYKFPHEFTTKEKIDYVEYVIVNLPERSYRAKAELFHRDFINEGKVIDTDLDWVFKFEEPVPVGTGLVLTIGAPYQSIKKAVKDIENKILKQREEERAHEEESTHLRESGVVRPE